MTRPRKGFALVTVLWVTVGLGVLGALALTEVRTTVDASRNRVNLTRAHWRAFGCAEVARASIDAHLLGTNDPIGQAAHWRTLGRAITTDAVLRQPGCTISVEADGDRIPLNTASAQQLERYLATRTLSTRPQALVVALLDWRDLDDSTRDGEAERAYYAAHGRLGPRNGPFADPEEVRLVAGFELADSALISHLGASSARVSLNSAPREVLLSLPGMSVELARRIEAMAAAGNPVHELSALPSLVVGAARDTLLAHFGELSELATVDPGAWLLRATVEEGSPSVQRTIEMRLLRSETGAVTSRWRVW